MAITPKEKELVAIGISVAAALGWFLHAIVFIVASAWVVLVLYRREFRSRSLRAVCE